MQKNPLVSIIIPTYNRRDLLSRALNSALNQTYKNIEIIVVDDGSSDNTKELVKSYQKKYDHIFYLKNKTPQGANAARNKGILKAGGYFIAGLDDDDEFLPLHIENLVQNYDEKYSLISTNNINIYDDKIKKTYIKSIITLDDMLWDNVLSNFVMVEKKRLVELGLYDEKLSAYQDYDMWMRLILRYGDAKVLPCHTLKYHTEKSRDRISTRTYKRFSGYFNFYKKYKKFMNISQKKNILLRLYKIRKKNMSSSVFSFFYINDFVKADTFANDFIANLSLNLNKLKNLKENYILYGYGSVASLILPHLKEKIVAIVDEGLSKQDINHIDNIKVIKKEQLKTYKDETILISAIRYKKEIVKDLKKYNLTIKFI